MHWLNDDELKKVNWWPQDMRCDQIECEQWATRILEANEAGLFVYCPDHGTLEEGASD